MSERPTHRSERGRRSTRRSKKGQEAHANVWEGSKGPPGGPKGPTGGPLMVRRPTPSSGRRRELPRAVQEGS